MPERVNAEELRERDGAPPSQGHVAGADAGGELARFTILSLQRTAGNAAVASLLASKPARPIVQRVVEIRPSVRKIPRYEDLVEIFLNAFRTVAPELWELVQGEHVVLRLRAEPLQEYANTYVVHEETVPPRREGEKGKRNQKWLVGALADADLRERIRKGAGKVVIEITFNSDATAATGPQRGGAMLATFAHELYAHAEKAARYIRMWIKLHSGQDLEGLEKKRVAVHSEQRSAAQDTREAHQALATGDDKELEGRLEDTRKYLAERFPDEAYADEFALELETDRRGRAADFHKGKGFGKVYVGSRVFEPEEVRAIVPAARELLKAFARVNRLGLTLTNELLAEFDALNLLKLKSIDDDQLHGLVKKLRSKYLGKRSAENAKLSTQLAAAASLASLYGWSESQTTRLIREGKLRDGMLAAAKEPTSGRPRTDFSGEYIS